MKRSLAIFCCFVMLFTALCPVDQHFHAHAEEVLPEESNCSHRVLCTNQSVCIDCGQEATGFVVHDDTCSEKEYISDDLCHWYVCVYCHDQEGAYVDYHYTYDCSNPTVCAECGHEGGEINVYHDNYPTEYAHNETSHWEVCSNCGVPSMNSGESMHSANCSDPTVCRVCNAQDIVVEEHNIYHADTTDYYSYNENGHWLSCEVCGYVLSDTWGHTRICGTSDPNVCVVCGGEDVEMEYIQHGDTVEANDDLQHGSKCVDCDEWLWAFLHMGSCVDRTTCYGCGATGEGVQINGFDHVNKRVTYDNEKHYSTCMDCGFSWEDEHYTYCDGSGTCNCCGAQGDTFRVLHYGPDEYSYDEQTHWMPCTMCDDYYEAPMNHRDIDEDGRCDVCDATDVDLVCEHQMEYRSVGDYHRKVCVLCDWWFSGQQHYADCENPNVCLACGAEAEIWDIRHTAGDYLINETYHTLLCIYCNELMEEWRHYDTCLEPGVCVECGATDVNIYDTHHSTNINFDIEKHYEVCTDCGETIIEGAHFTYCNKPTVCDLCGAEGVVFADNHHCGRTRYESTETEHWPICRECGEVTGEREPHRAKCNDPACCYICRGVDVTDAIVEHNWSGVTGSGSVSSGGQDHDDEYHWDVCARCGITGNKEKHTAWCDQPDVCEDCGAQNVIIDSFLHSESTEYKNDDTYHWTYCDFCDEVVTKAEHTVDCSSPEWCLVCGVGDIVQADPSLQHVFSDEWTVTDYYDHGKTCQGCDSIYWEGHKRNCDGDTCIVCGLTDVNFYDYNVVHAYDMSYDATHHQGVCVTCGNVSEEGLHYAKCTAPNVCVVCGGEDVEMEYIQHGDSVAANDDLQHGSKCVDCDEWLWTSSHLGSCVDQTTCHECGATGEGVQFAGYSHLNNQLTYDDQMHYDTCMDCGKISWEGDHYTYCDESGTCSYCGAEGDTFRVVHYSTYVYSYDEQTHWLPCTMCDDYYVAPMNHRDIDEDGLCDVCLATDVDLVCEHQMEYRSEGDWHWQVCVLCAWDLPSEQHYAGCENPNVCLACGAEGEIWDIRHTAGDYLINETCHTLLCIYCNWLISDIDHFDTCLEPGVCAECGATDVNFYDTRHGDININFDPEKHYDVCTDCNETIWEGEHYTYCNDTTVCDYCGLEGAVFADNYHYGPTHYESTETEHRQICEECGQVAATDVHRAWCDQPEVCAECGATDVTIAEVMHDGTDEYFSDDTYHWQYCTVCEQYTEKTEHTVNCSSRERCLVCDATGIVQADPSLQHVFPDEPSFADNEWHYYRCVNCGTGYGYSHTGACNGTTCDTCGETGVIINQPIHNNMVYEITDERHVGTCNDCGWVFDEEVHFDLCDAQGICHACGATDVIFSYTGHTDTSNTWDDQYHYEVCDLCGEVLSEGMHARDCSASFCYFCGQQDVTFNTVWHWSDPEQLQHDDTQHWNPCGDCGEPTNVMLHVGLCTAPDVCTDCGAEGIVIETDHLAHDKTHEEIRYNDTDHWKVCGDCGLVVDEPRKHYNACGEDVCDECGAADVVFEYTVHNIETLFTETHHQDVCTVCGYVDFTEAHYGWCSEPNVCMYCNADNCTIEPRRLSHTGDRHSESDQTHHWMVCETCDGQIYKEEHINNCNGNECVECGAVDVTFGGSLHQYRVYSDETCHWDGCANCDYIGYTEEHYASCDHPTVCLYCGREDIEPYYLEHEELRYEVTADYHQAYCDSEYCQGAAVREAEPHYTFCYNPESSYCYGCGEQNVNLTDVYHGAMTICFDEEKHWMQCEDCFECLYEEAHYHSCDDLTVCDHCGLEGDFSANPVHHPLEEQIREHNDEQHWAICGSCGDYAFEPDRHFTICSDSNICVFCQVEVPGELVRMHRGDFIVVQYDETSHWSYCTLCEAVSGEPVEHYSHCQQPDVCHYCGMQSDEGIPVGSHTTDGPESALYNGTHHWWMCLDCGQQVYYGAHIAEQSDPDNCLVCGAEMPKLAIVQQPVDVAAQEGEIAEVSFEATGKGLTYTWYYKNAGATKFSKTSTFTGNTYSVEMNADRDGRQVYCVVKDFAGNTVQTDTVTLTMVNPVKITQQPTDAAALEGETAEVSFVAEGDGLIYTWYYKNAGASKFSKTSSFDSNLYFIEMNETRDGRQVYCVVTDKYGNTVQTDTVTLTMLNPVRITEQPVDAEGFEGETVEVSFTAEGEGLTYTWYYKNAGATKFSKTSTFDSNFYTMEMTEARDGRQIYCVVTDQYGSTVQTDTVTLTMLKTVKITQQPVSVSVAGGETVEVSFTAEGDGLTYAWYYKNAGASKFTKTSTFDSNFYTMEMNATRDGRQIYCVVTDQYGNSVQTNTVTLTMLSSLKITRQPESVSGVEGETVEVSFTAEGDGLTYAWYYKNAGASKFTKTSTFTGNTYTMEMNATRDGRQIYCVVTDQYGNTVQTDTVTLTMKASGLKITKQLEPATAANGETVEVSFTAEGEGLTYAWYYKNAGASKFSKTSTFTGNSYSMEMNDTRNGRQIYCVVTDKYGNTVQTDTVTLTMVNQLKITKQPVSVAVAIGETVEVSFTAEGEGLTYAWYYKNAGATKFSKTSTFTGNTYSMEMTSARADRQIYCVVTDQYGNTVQTNTVTLSVAK